ncbi:MAG TPA: class I SAM-dependent methyltransferase, partial [Solirubrobacteraceae bacterium]|nr:class I SAM-dependent methyltransferase [Solirubrobacteraceae bacterium]
MPTSRANRIRLAVSRSRPYLRARDLMLRSGRSTYWVVREDLARRYLRGQGIEIGALTTPLRVPPGVEVRYVDRADRAELLASDGPSLASSGVDPDRIVPVDVVADAERLSEIDDDSVDFVIAAHVLEHLEDPIEGLTNMLRVIRPGGVLLLVLPDPRFTFDAPRVRTTVEHVLADHASGPETSRAAHHLEWAEQIEGHRGENLEARLAQLAGEEPSHHFHVWELSDFLELLLALGLPCEITHAQAYAKEFAVVLTATAPDRAAPGAATRPAAATECVALPTTVAVEPDATVVDYTRARLRQHTDDSYASVPLSKFPEDLRVYEHLLWLSDPDVVIELGTQFGASALWFRDRLNALSRYRPGRRRRVISIDYDLRLARESLGLADRSPASQITLIEADVTDPSLPDRVAALIEPNARCFVIEDTAHVYETTRAALDGFARFVPPGGFFVVEDGCVDVDELRIDEDWPRGVLPALHDWLQT